MTGFFSQCCDGADANDWKVSLRSRVRMEESGEADFVAEFDRPVASFNGVQLVADDAVF